MRLHEELFATLFETQANKEQILIIMIMFPFHKHKKERRKKTVVSIIRTNKTLFTLGYCPIIKMENNFIFTNLTTNSYDTSLKTNI